MSMKILTDAPSEIYEYDQESYDRLTKEDVKYSEMTHMQRKFVHGLIRYMQPKRILEVGVAEGGGSIVILNAIEDMPHTTLTSIDIETSLSIMSWNNNDGDVGFACKQKYNQSKQWNLITGMDPSEIIEELGEADKFDFAIIDTAHTHPVESLNFLCVYPFLTENCAVVLHDIALYSLRLAHTTPFSDFPSLSFATKLLFDTMIGTKRVLSTENPASNIGVCQLNEDSGKYIENIFSMLKFPWGLYPSSMNSISAFLQKYYSDELYQQFSSAVRLDKLTRLLNNPKGTKFNTNPRNYGVEKLVFYGFGSFFTDNIMNADIFSHHVQEIWDKFEEISTKTSSSGNQHFIQHPNLNYEDKDNLLIVITLSPFQSDLLIQEIKTELNDLGFPNVIHYIDLEKY